MPLDAPDDIFSRLDSVHQCDRQADRQTDRQTDGQTPADSKYRAYALRREVKRKLMIENNKILN